MIPAQRTVLIGVDYSDQSVHAVDEALRAAAPVAGTRLVPVLVLPVNTLGSTPDVAEMTRELVDRSKDNLQSLLAARANVLGISTGSIEPRVRFGTPATELLTLARELGANLIAVGTHGRQGLSHLLLGSVAEELMRKATCSVLVARSPQTSAGELADAPGARGVVSSAPLPFAQATVAGGERQLATEEPELAEPTIVSGPHIDAGRVVLHVLDPLSHQVFVCAFASEEEISVEPLEGSWVPAPSSTARARAAQIALDTRAGARARFAELFAEIARRRAHKAP
jgi:nucleotide-binding universal stress UspA family protein